MWKLGTSLNVSLANQYSFLKREWKEIQSAYKYLAQVTKNGKERPSDIGRERSSRENIFVNL